MVIAALISFGILLVTWIAAPGDEPRRHARTSLVDRDSFPAEGVAGAA